MAILYQQESYKIIGLCMEVHNNLGTGFSEIVYKDALEYEFKLNNISFEREKKFEVIYKDVLLPHCFYADFIALNSIILEVKAKKEITDIDMAQAINYLHVTGKSLAIIINFGEERLAYKRVVL